ncbi:MAG: hypothetical protein WC667_04885 [Sulfurimonas sp.]|jgi:hypothetical protein
MKVNLFNKIIKTFILLLMFLLEIVEKVWIVVSLLTFVGLVLFLSLEAMFSQPNPVEFFSVLLVVFMLGVFLIYTVELLFQPMIDMLLKIIVRIENEK